MKKEKNDWSCLEDVPSIADDFDAKAARQACHCMFICFESILKAFEPWIRLIWVSVYCICTLVHSKFGRHQMRGIHFQFIQISVIDKLAVFGYLVRWLAVYVCVCIAVSWSDFQRAHSFYYVVTVLIGDLYILNGEWRANVQSSTWNWRWDDHLLSKCGVLKCIICACSCY